MRYLLGFLVTIGLIVLIIVLLLTGGSKKGATTPKAIHLDDYAYSNSATASYTLDGPIVANQEHYTLKINVSQTQVEGIVYQGYDQTPLRDQTYPNNPRAFAVFIHSLNLAGFTIGNNGKALQDERGYCPAGNRTIYQLTDGSNTLTRFWHASCGEGTFKGNISNVSYLFKHQIPSADFPALTQGTNLGL